MTTPKKTDAAPTLDDSTEPIKAEVVESAASVPAVRDGNGHEGALAIPTNDDGAVVSLIAPDPEWADVESGDLAPTAFRISHLSVNRNLDGGFVDADTGEKSAGLDFVWLAKSKSRAWFRDPFGKGENAPSCRSFDGVKADPASPDLQNHGDCTTCPLAVWKDGEKPACRESVESLIFIPDALGDGRLAWLRWSGIAVRPAREFWQSFDARMPKRPPIAYVSHVELVPTDTGFGQKLAPQFQRVKELTRSAAQPLIDERDRRIADWQADVAESVVTTTAADHDEEANGSLPAQEWREGQAHHEGPEGEEEPF